MTTEPYPQDCTDEMSQWDEPIPYTVTDLGKAALS